MDERVSISEAARRLGLHKSTVSRQCNLAQLVGDDGLISLSAYQSWRTGQRDEAKAPAATAGAGAGGQGADAPTPGYVGSKARRELALARAAELDLAEREGKLIDRGAVETAVFEAARKLRDGLAGLALKLGSELAAETDAVAVRSRLDREHAALLKRFADDFARGASQAGE